MADPVIAGGLRAQFILRGKTGLPEDRYVTTWAFRTIDGLPPDAGHNVAVKDLLSEFYVGVTAPQTGALRTFLSSAVDQPQTEVRVYRLGDSVPREPTIYAVNLGASLTTALPSEVALCASFFSERNLPRRRGRIYFGPLATNTNDQPGSIASRPVSQVRTALLESMKRLRSASVAKGLQWSVLSQVDGVMRPVTGGWVDDAWDTQRRRGEAAAARQTWAGPLV
jgi:hypothetical protein